MLEGFGLHIPAWLSMAPGYALDAAQKLAESGATSLTAADKHGLEAYLSAPRIGDIPIIFDLPAGIITVLVTALVYIGIKESQRASAVMEMESNPIKAKNTAATLPITPCIPFGAKGVQFSGFT